MAVSEILGSAALQAVREPRLGMTCGLRGSVVEMADGLVRVERGPRFCRGGGWGRLSLPSAQEFALPLGVGVGVEDGVLEFGGGSDFVDGVH